MASPSSAVSISARLGSAGKVVRLAAIGYSDTAIIQARDGLVYRIVNGKRVGSTKSEFEVFLYYT